MRFAVLLPLLLTCSGCSTQTERPTRGEIAVPKGNLSEALFWASAKATGARLCDRELAARYQAEFDHRFGTRVRALMAAHEARYGKDPGFVVVSSCVRPLRPVDETHVDPVARERVMRDFDRWLTDVEHGRTTR